MCVYARLCVQMYMHEYMEAKTTPGVFPQAPSLCGRGCVCRGLRTISPQAPFNICLERISGWPKCQPSR